MARPVEEIIGEIQRLATENGGVTPSTRALQEAGIPESEWRCVYWARWSDAVAAAGLEPNLTPEERKIADDVLLGNLARACRHFGRLPTVAELKLYRRQNPEFPYDKTIARRFGGFSGLASHVLQWVEKNAEFSDVAALLGIEGQDAISAGPVRDGSVYLLKSGSHYKIGRSEEIERRVKEIRVALPEAAQLVHAISTDDTVGIEAYWHRRFAENEPMANGLDWMPRTSRLSSDGSSNRHRKTPPSNA